MLPRIGGPRAVVLTALLCVSAAARADEDLRILRAGSPTIDIQDGDRALKAIWNADPSVAIDIYDARITRAPKRITFTSDVDAITFDVEPGHAYDFVILLDGARRCRTRISTMRQGHQAAVLTANGSDGIPITISHGKLHVRGQIDGSEVLDLILDTGADTNVLYPSGRDKVPALALDGKIASSGTGGTTLREVSRDHRVTIGGMSWEHEPLVYVAKQADVADGIVGYPLFEADAIELDHEHGVLRVYPDGPPAHAATFSRTPMVPMGSLTGVAAVLGTGTELVSGLFILDTGGTGTLLVNQAFAAAHGLPGGLKALGTSRSTGVGSGIVANDVALFPELSVADLPLKDVPVHIERPSAGAEPASPGGKLCLEVLQRYDTILDYPHGQAYFKPSSLFERPFEMQFGPPPIVFLAAAACASALLAGCGWMVVRRRRRAAAGLAAP